MYIYTCRSQFGSVDCRIVMEIVNGFGRHLRVKLLRGSLPGKFHFKRHRQLYTKVHRPHTLMKNDYTKANKDPGTCGETCIKRFQSF